MKIKTISLITALCLIVSSSAFALGGCGAKTELTCPDNLGENDFLHNSAYHLVWSDEFDGESLNTDNWIYETGYVRNNEPQYYTDREKNIFVKDSYLNLVCLREDYTAEDGTTAEYTSAAIETKGKQSFKYGAIEILAKLPNNYNPSCWPAFWMMGEEGYWPYSGETDIMEMYGTDITRYEANVHWADESTDDNYNNIMKRDGRVIDYQLTGEALGNEWHTYGIDWDETSMRFYCDDQTLGTVDITDDTMTELHMKNFLLLDLALTKSSIDNVDDSMFPLTYQIDYVRVYQKN